MKPKWEPNLSQKRFGKHLKCNAYLYAIFEHIWDPPGRSDSSMGSPLPPLFGPFRPSETHML